MCQLKKAVEKLVCLTLVGLGSKKPSFCDQKKDYLCNTMCQHQKAVKIVCLAVVRLGTNENTALGANKSYLHNMMRQLQKAVETSVFGTNVAWN